MDIPKYEELNDANCQERSIKKHYPEFYEYLMTKFPEYTWGEKLALYYYGLEEPPRCVVCGKAVKFYSFRRGWARTCSVRCTGKDPEVVCKKIKRSIEKYGTSNPMQSQEVKDKIKKTCLERYGVENPFMDENVKQRIKQHNLEKYGGNSPMCSSEIREKSSQTCLDKYGVEYTSQYRDGKTIYEKYPLLIEHLPGDMWMCKCPHEDCDKCKEKYFITQPNIIYDRTRLGVELCTRLHPVSSQSSSYGLKIQNLLKDLNIPFETHVRNIIPPKELDIYIPSKSLAIEINGCYWHSDKEKPKKYHLDKFLECKSKGIQLIQIWEDWLINKPEIVKSILLNKLGLTPNHIYARNCELREVSAKDATKFLDENHIQGRSQSMVRLGLYYKDQLVSLMTFGPKRACMGDSKGDIMGYELVRFCNILNTNIVGGASKLLKEFIRQYSPKYIISYSSNDISFGNLYNTLGFESGEVSTSYWYIEPETMHRYHRTSFSRSGIARKFGYDIKDMSWSEHNVMDELGYIRIYDAGTTRWVLECINE